MDSRKTGRRIRTLLIPIQNMGSAPALVLHNVQRTATSRKTQMRQPRMRQPPAPRSRDTETELPRHRRKGATHQCLENPLQKRTRIHKRKHLPPYQRIKRVLYLSQRKQEAIRSTPRKRRGLVTSVALTSQRSSGSTRPRNISANRRETNTYH